MNLRVDSSNNSQKVHPTETARSDISGDISYDVSSETELISNRTKEEKVLESKSSNMEKRKRKTMLSKRKDTSLETDSGIDTVSLPKNAVMRVKLHISYLKRPPSTIGTSSKAPNPYYEIFLTRIPGDPIFYRSYPLMRQSEGKWDEVTLDIGVPLEEIHAMQVTIRIMHCRKRGGHPRIIGLYRKTLFEAQQKIGSAHPIVFDYEIRGWLRFLTLVVE